MEWIKCSERLPEKRGYYLAAFEDGHVAEDEYYGPEHKQWWLEARPLAPHGVVTHWQPLPPPPSPETE